MPCNSECFEPWILHLCYGWKAKTIELGHDRSKTARSRAEHFTDTHAPDTHFSHPLNKAEIQGFHITRSCVSAEYNFPVIKKIHICFKGIHLLLVSLVKSDELGSFSSFSSSQGPRCKFWPGENWGKGSMNCVTRTKKYEKPQIFNQCLVAALSITCAFLNSCKMWTTDVWV